MSKSTAENVIITPTDAYNVYSKLGIRKTGAKSASLETITHILSTEPNVIVQPKPKDPKLGAEWEKEKKRIITAFDSVLKSKNRKKNKSKVITFYDSAKYPTLTKIKKVASESVDKDFEPQLSDAVESENDNIPTTSKVGAPTLPLFTLGRSQFITRTKGIKKAFQDFCSTEQVPADRVLGVIGKKTYLTEGENRDQNKGKMFKKIAEGKDPFEKKQMTPDQGIYVQDTLAIGRTKYTDHAKYMSQFGVQFASTPNIKKRRLEFTPELKKGPNEGIWVNLFEATQIVTKETIVHLAKDSFDQLVNDDPVNWLLEVEIDCGFDGVISLFEFQAD